MDIIRKITVCFQWVILSLFVVVHYGCIVESSSNNYTEAGYNWPIYGGNNLGNRYSPLDQINKTNVAELKPVWIYDSNLPGQANKGQIQCQPIVINEILYGTSSDLRLFALMGDTGEEIWSFSPKYNSDKKAKNTSRGVTYWEKAGDKRILYTVGSNIYAINARTGLIINSFGDNGKVDLHEGLDSGIDQDINRLSVTATSPGVVYNDLYIIGSSVSEGGNAAPGHIRAFSVITGKLEWVFHTIPQPGELGYETWPKDAYKEVGGVNNWAGMVVDFKRGAVYFGTGSPSSDFYGGNRKGKNLYANCIISLDASSGKLNWYYQTVYHDLWDRDVSCQPNLTTINFNGKTIDVVAQATKDGLLYVLDRDTGKSLFPVEERSVPTDGLPGEEVWDVQKFPLKPEPFSNQLLTESDLTQLSEESNRFVKEQFKNYSSENKFEPPSENGTLLFGYSGGAEWGGNAVDKQGILYQNANHEPWILQMISVDSIKSEVNDRLGQSVYVKNCVMCHGVTREGSGLYPSLLDLQKRFTRAELTNNIVSGVGRMPAFGHLSSKELNSLINFLMELPENEGEKSKHEIIKGTSLDSSRNSFGFEPKYVVKTWKKLEDQDGYPGIKPPWGTLNAIDLNTGEYLWKIPLGEYKELTKKGVSKTGTINYGGPIVTAGGLIFIASTRDERIRALDKHTGSQLWAYNLPAAGFATPITYKVKNKQYVVIAAGGGRGLKYSGKYLAFAL